MPSFLQLALPGMEGPADPAERVEALCASVARLARFEPASVLCLSGPVGDRSEDEARALVRDGLREVAAAARAAGVRLGLEPTHLSESGETSFLSSIGDAIALLDEAGLDDVGVMVDSVHVWDTAGLAAEVALHASRVTGLHVADKLAPGAPGRVLPGEGVTPPRAARRAAARSGLRRLRRYRDLLDAGRLLGTAGGRGGRARRRRRAFADRAIMSAMDYRALGTTGTPGLAHRTRLRQLRRHRLGSRVLRPGRERRGGVRAHGRRVRARHQRLRHGQCLRRRAQRDGDRQVARQARLGGARPGAAEHQGLQSRGRRPERPRPLAPGALSRGRREPRAPGRRAARPLPVPRARPGDAARGDARRARRPAPRGQAALRRRQQHRGLATGARRSGSATSGSSRASSGCSRATACSTARPRPRCCRCAPIRGSASRRSRRSRAAG